MRSILPLSMVFVIGAVAFGQNDPVADALVRGLEAGRRQRESELQNLEAMERIKRMRLESEVIRRQLEKTDPEIYKQELESERQSALASLRKRHRDADKLMPAIEALARDLVRPAGSSLTVEQYIEVLYWLTKQRKVIITP